VSVFSADWDLEAAIMANSRPQHTPPLPQPPLPRPTPPSSTAPVPPTLAEVLADTSPAPWTLAAFMAYLSQNHCLETLEFTMDAQRYKAAYDQIRDHGPVDSGNAHLYSLWEKLAQAYLVPCAPREINVPSHVRERLLDLCPSALPPRPEELREAVDTVKELMNDSVFSSFLEAASASVAGTGTGTVSSSSTGLTRTAGRSSLRMPKHRKSSPTSPSSASSPASTSSQIPFFFSPKSFSSSPSSSSSSSYMSSSNLMSSSSSSYPQQPQPPQPHHYHHHHHHHHHHLFHLRSPSDSTSSDTSASPEIPEHDPAAADDSLGGFDPSASMDLVSPPMTPPTPDSPGGGFHRVMAAPTSAWKKVKLGFKKKARSPGVAATSPVLPAEDLVMTDAAYTPVDAVVTPFDGTPFDGAPYSPAQLLSQASHSAPPLPQVPRRE